MKAKNVEIFTWREIKNTVEVYLESWLIARVGEEEWTILEEDDEGGNLYDCGFDELGYKNDLKYERTQVDKAFSILEDRVSPSKLISASRFLGVKSPWTVGVPCEESTHELYDLLGLSPDDFSDWGLLTYVLWALDICGYAYAVDKEESKIAMNILKRSMTEDCAYQEYASILYAEVFMEEKYGSPAEVEEILRAHIIKAVSPFQAQTFFFAIDHPNAPLTSGEKEAIAIVEAEIKNSHLIESL